MWKFFSVLLIVCFVAISGHVSALTLSLNPATQDLLLGEDLVLDLVVGGLDAGGPDSLGAFSLGILYDSTVFSLTDVNFGTLLGDIDFYEADGFVDDSIPGSVYVEEVSFLFDYELDAIQGESFSLASLQFNSIATGVSSFDISSVIASDASGFTLTVTSVENASASVAPVPEPATMLLFGTGLVGVIGSRLRKKR